KLAIDLGVVGDVVAQAREHAAAFHLRRDVLLALALAIVEVPPVGASDRGTAGIDRTQGDPRGLTAFAEVQPLQWAGGHNRTRRAGAWRRMVGDDVLGLAVGRGVVGVEDVGPPGVPRPRVVTDAVGVIMLGADQEVAEILGTEGPAMGQRQTEAFVVTVG